MEFWETSHMAKVNVEASLSSEQLLKAVSQLNSPDLEEFVQRVLVLQAQRRVLSLSHDEDQLLRDVHRRLPADLRHRYDTLVAKRRAETLTHEEHEELLRLANEVEAHNTRRVESLAKLSLLRQVPLDQLMMDLDLHWPEDA
jgi:hypothetical protein